MQNKPLLAGAKGLFLLHSNFTIFKHSSCRLSCFPNLWMLQCATKREMWALGQLNFKSSIFPISPLNALVSHVKTLPSSTDTTSQIPFHLYTRACFMWFTFLMFSSNVVGTYQALKMNDTTRLQLSTCWHKRALHSENSECKVIWKGRWGARTAKLHCIIFLVQVWQNYFLWH